MRRHFCKQVFHSQGETKQNTRKNCLKSKDHCCKLFEVILICGSRGLVVFNLCLELCACPVVDLDVTKMMLLHATFAQWPTLDLSSSISMVFIEVYAPGH